MMMDKEVLFSDSQAITTGAAASTNIVDLGAAATDNLGNTPIKDLGRAREVEILIQVDETFTSGGAGTLAIAVQTSASDDLSSPTTLQTTAALAKTVLVAGYNVRLHIPRGVAQRYLGLLYTVATADMTAGKITAGIVLDRQSNQATI